MPSEQIRISPVVPVSLALDGAVFRDDTKYLEVDTPDGVIVAICVGNICVPSVRPDGFV